MTESAASAQTQLTASPPQDRIVGSWDAHGVPDGMELVGHHRQVDTDAPSVHDALMAAAAAARKAKFKAKKEAKKEAAKARAAADAAAPPTVPPTGPGNEADSSAASVDLLPSLDDMLPALNDTQDGLARKILGDELVQMAQSMVDSTPRCCPPAEVKQALEMCAPTMDALLAYLHMPALDKLQPAELQTVFSFQQMRHANCQQPETYDDKRDRECMRLLEMLAPDTYVMMSLMRTTVFTYEAARDAAVDAILMHKRIVKARARRTKATKNSAAEKVAPPPPMPSYFSSFDTNWLAACFHRFVNVCSVVVATDQNEIKELAVVLTLFTDGETRDLPITSAAQADKLPLNVRSGARTLSAMMDYSTHVPIELQCRRVLCVPEGEQQQQQQSPSSAATAAPAPDSKASLEMLRRDFVAIRRIAVTYRGSDFERLYNLYEAYKAFEMPGVSKRGDFLGLEVACNLYRGVLANVRTLQLLDDDASKKAGGKHFSINANYCVAPPSIPVVCAECRRTIAPFQFPCDPAPAAQNNCCSRSVLAMSYYELSEIAGSAQQTSRA